MNGAAIVRTRLHIAGATAVDIALAGVLISVDRQSSTPSEREASRMSMYASVMCGSQPNLNESSKARDRELFIHS